MIPSSSWKERNCPSERPDMLSHLRMLHESAKQRRDKSRKQSTSEGETRRGRGAGRRPSECAASDALAGRSHARDAALRGRTQHASRSAFALAQPSVQQQHALLCLFLTLTYRGRAGGSSRRQSVSTSHRGRCRQRIVGCNKANVGIRTRVEFYKGGGGGGGGGDTVSNGLLPSRIRYRIQATHECSWQR